jgi:3-dehydroquinate dehydratase I
MKIVAALTDASYTGAARDKGADMIEFRLDLMHGDILAQITAAKKEIDLPIIATLRSADDGGNYFGNADEWFEKIEPLLPLVEYIDIEQRFSVHAAAIKSAGKMIIASHHDGRMMPLHVLFILERELREYGDIPKIIMTPANRDDIIELLAFTHAAKKPICTGVMGKEFRYARAMLPFFGSELAYCHMGAATADGQYSVEEFVDLMKWMKPVE